MNEWCAIGERVDDVDVVLIGQAYGGRMLHTENNNLRMRVKALHQTVDAITAKNITFLSEHNAAMIASGDGKNKLWHFISV